MRKPKAMRVFPDIQLHLLRNELECFYWIWGTFSGGGAGCLGRKTYKVFLPGNLVLDKENGGVWQSLKRCNIGQPNKKNKEMMDFQKENKGKGSCHMACNGLGMVFV